MVVRANRRRVVVGRARMEMRSDRMTVRRDRMVVWSHRVVMGGNRMLVRRHGMPVRRGRRRRFLAMPCKQSSPFKILHDDNLHRASKRLSDPSLRHVASVARLRGPKRKN